MSRWFDKNLSPIDKCLQDLHFVKSALSMILSAVDFDRLEINNLLSMFNNMLDMIDEQNVEVKKIIDTLPATDEEEKEQLRSDIEKSLKHAYDTLEMLSAVDYEKIEMTNFYSILKGTAGSTERALEIAARINSIISQSGESNGK